MTKRRTDKTMTKRRKHTTNNEYKTSRSCVRLQSGVTDFFSVHLGVKQGDNLTPNLFKIFINDLPSYLDKSLDPVYLDEKPIHCLMYADDMVSSVKS
jgi:hypothetical protein